MGVGCEEDEGGWDSIYIETPLNLNPHLQDVYSFHLLRIKAS